VRAGGSLQRESCTATREMPRAQEADVEGRAPGAVEELPLEGSPPSGEERARGVSRGSRVGRTGAHRYPRPRLGCRILRASGECCRGPRRRYHPLIEERPPNPHLRPAGADKIEMDKVKSERPDGGHRGNDSYLTREEHQGCHRRQDWWTRLRGWLL
jgi:hypothetical protein